jgi:hypothetical protein
MYYPSSVHLEVQGNDVVAVAVAAFLEDVLADAGGGALREFGKCD